MSRETQTADHLLKIGKIARGAGVPVDTIRYYEQRGLIEKPARLATGYRVYAPETISRIRFIKRAQQLGLCLKDINALLALSRRDEGNREAARQSAVRTLSEIETKMRQLTALRDALSAEIEGLPANDGPATASLIVAALAADAGDVRES